ncbi:MAG: hypothetical protein ACI4WH_06000 [Oscillospiraceae bacterium]
MKKSESVFVWKFELRENFLLIFKKNKTSIKTKTELSFNTCFISCFILVFGNQKRRKYMERLP